MQIIVPEDLSRHGSTGLLSNNGMRPTDTAHVGPLPPSSRPPSSWAHVKQSETGARHRDGDPLRGGSLAGRARTSRDATDDASSPRSNAVHSSPVSRGLEAAVLRASSAAEVGWNGYPCYLKIRVDGCLSFLSSHFCLSLLICGLYWSFVLLILSFLFLFTDMRVTLLANYLLVSCAPCFSSFGIAVYATSSSLPSPPTSFFCSTPHVSTN